MLRFWSRDRSRCDRRPRAFRPAEPTNLETRELPATIISFLTATPPILNPPDNKFVTVTVSGGILETNVKLTPRVKFQVTDEYRQIEPQGNLTLTKVAPTAYLFTFTLKLQAKRANEFLGGRHYYVLVSTVDSENAYGKYVTVLVPHNKLPAGQTTINGPVQKLKLLPPKRVR